MSTGRQIAFVIYAFRITDVQQRATGMNDLLSIELRNDDLKMVNQVWEQILMAMDMEPEMAFFDHFFTIGIGQSRSS